MKAVINITVTEPTGAKAEVTIWPPDDTQKVIASIDDPEALSRKGLEDVATVHAVSMLMGRLAKQKARYHDPHLIQTIRVMILSLMTTYNPDALIPPTPTPENS